MRRILKVSSSQGCLGKNIGCEDAPDKIVGYLKNNFFIESVDVDNWNIEKTNKNIFDKADGFNGIILGGDHSITYSAFRALASKHKKTGLIMFDAHVDCTSYIKPPSHEDFLRVLVEDKVVNIENVFIFGVRHIYAAEEKYLKRKKVNLVKVKSVPNHKEGINQMEKTDAVYLSIDIDVFDQKLAIGTGYPEKNGLGKKEMLRILNKIKKLKNLKIVDIVEVNPRLDKEDRTVKLAAYLADYFYG